MLKICDGCNASFDVFNEGNVSDYNVALCNFCWATEAAIRNIRSLMNAGK